MAEQKKWGDMTKKEKQSGIIGLVILTFIVIAIIGSLNGSNKTVNDASNAAGKPTSQQTTQPTAFTTPKADDPKVSIEYKSALIQATSYATTMHLSKQGVYDQLVSEYGGKFKPEAAQYAVDNVKANWNANALAQAKSYQNDLHLSPAAIRDQLVSPYGGKFTPSEADYAVQHLND